ncbi:hypothetical protein RN001_002492 [Aquatica leii]|uniref:Hormone-sensitive lipase n=1 Tax=Aquatica leii TaxID=1421715 RepID=A0AAN7PPX6_9COLE|nr:hypothetical protein RN001_002492 [Aquatica leii]
MIDTPKPSEETSETNLQLNSESADINIGTLQDLCENNINFFSSDTSENGQRLNNSFKLINEAVNKMRPVLIDLRCVAVKYTFHDVSANGYYSYLAVINNVVLQTIQLNKKVCLRRSNILFRKSAYTKEVEAYASLMQSLFTFGLHLNTFSAWHKNNDLHFIDIPDEILAKVKEINQYPFYGHNLGFQFCESLRPVLRFVCLSMVIFSEAFYSQGSILTKAKNSVTTTAKYLMDPEERAKRMINIFHYTNLDFLKSFWFLAESELMKQVPIMVGQSVAVSKVIQIPPQALTLHVDNNDVEIPIPHSHIGKRPVQVRLISHEVRQGMIGEANSKTKFLSPSRGLMIHCHGGGFCAQSSQSHECYLRQWAKDLQIPILSIDYSLTPQAPYPRAVEEVVYAYSWALQNSHLLGTTAERVVFTGDSAGGNLLLGLIQRCIVLNIPLPAGILAIYSPTWITSYISPSRLLSLMDPLIPLGFAIRIIKAYVLPSKVNGNQINQLANGEYSSDTESFGEISQSDLVELQAHKSPVSDASESITCGSLSSPTVELKDINKQDLNQIDIVSESNQNTGRSTTSVDLLDKYILESDTETDETKVAVLNEQNNTQGHETSTQSRLVSVVTSLRNRIGNWVTSSHTGTNLSLESNQPFDILEQVKYHAPVDPITSPFFASDDILTKFPVVKLLTTNMDPFLDDNILFGKKLKSLGKNVTLDVLESLPHGFLNFSLISKESEAGSKLCVQRINEILDLDSLPPLQVQS